MDKILKELIEEGLTRPQIGERIGKSESQVYRLLKRYGLRTKRYNNHDPNATHRVCRYCGKRRILDEFPLAGHGKPYRRWRCSTCYVKQKMDRIRILRLWIREIKSELKCSRCGNDDFRVLQFHHNGDKHFNIGDAARRGYAKERIKKEIDKCEAICANCHQIETFEGWQK
jgi:hypothetical protein